MVDITGKTIAELIDGTNAADRIEGLGGNDTLNGLSGNDLLDGGNDSDKIFGGRGNDALIGGDWQDELHGGDGNDSVSGGDGDDQIFGNRGNDVLYGGGGQDRVFGGSGNDILALTVTSDIAGSYYSGGSGNDQFMVLLSADDWFDDALREELFDLYANLQQSGGVGHAWLSTQNVTIQGFEQLAAEVDGEEIDLVDHPVIAVDDSVATDENVTLNSGSVLGNDTAINLFRSVELVQDVDRGALVFVTGAEGTPDGSFSFDTGTDFDFLAVGEHDFATFAYRAFDADGDFDDAEVQIRVNGVNDGPVLEASTLSGEVTELPHTVPNVGTATHSATGAVNFSDADVSDTHTTAFVENGAGYRGIFSIAASTSADQTTTGEVVWTFEVDDADINDLAAGQELIQSYDVTVDDGNGGTVTTTVTVTLIGANDPPIAQVSTLTAAVTETVTITLTGANDVALISGDASG